MRSGLGLLGVIVLAIIAVIGLASAGAVMPNELTARAFVGAVALPLLIGAVAAGALTIVFVIEAAKNEQVAAIRELTAAMRGLPPAGPKDR